MILIVFPFVRFVRFVVTLFWIFFPGQLHVLRRPRNWWVPRGFSFCV